ncbi:MAG: outer membrane beta-barrel protein [Gemmatimonadaceae bacterium]
MTVSTFVSRVSGRVFAALAMGIALPAGMLGAQASSNFELRPFVGGLVQTGQQRSLLENSVLAGADVSWQFQRNFAVTGSFAWAPSNDKAVSTNDARMDLYQYDLGVEARTSDLLKNPAWSVRPYAALGAGARTYNYRNLDNASAQTDFLGHGSIGVDIAPEASRAGLRIEARDNVSAFRGLHGELADRSARNDVQFTAGLTIRM